MAVDLFWTLYRLPKGSTINHLGGRGADCRERIFFSATLRTKFFFLLKLTEDAKKKKKNLGLN